MKLNLILSLIILSSFYTTNINAIEDLTIYAQADGSYTYRNTNYSLDSFPIEQALKDNSSGDNSPTVDSVAPITVAIYPVENVDINKLRKLVRPLAIKFHQRGAKVNTLFFNKVIPYLFKKPEFFQKKNIQ